MQAEFPIIERFSSISDRYDGIICDVWGVLHNGVRVTKPANLALAAARRRGLAVCMLTNAPRSPADVAALVAQLGGTDDAWDAIVSSGGATRQIMAARGNEPFFHMGPPRDTSIYDGLPAPRVSLADAAYILCTGLANDEVETAEDYRPQLEAALARDLELICANPDIVVERGDKLIPCAGAIAELYEQMGGRAHWVGKPHPIVYEQAFEKLAAVLGRRPEKSRVLAIGDALRTDVAGAAAFGIDCLLVLDGIHAAELGAGRDFSAAAVNKLLADAAARPTFATEVLRD